MLNANLPYAFEPCALGIGHFPAKLSRMRSRWSGGWIAVAVVGVLLASEHPAQAYIDPGSGSLIYQALLAGLLGLGFTLRRTTESLTRLVRRFSGRDASATPASDDSSDRR